MLRVVLLLRKTSGSSFDVLVVGFTFYILQPTRRALLEQSSPLLPDVLDMPCYPLWRGDGAW